MNPLDCTLLTDGSSDRQLIPLLYWILREKTQRGVSVTWANLGILGERPRTLEERIARTLEFYPCSLLFIHRDAETQPWEARLGEITRAAHGIPVVFVPVIPVRMQEAWFLFDEEAIRSAAGNPNGRDVLSLPPLDRVEALPDPKEVLFALLRRASGLSGRRLKRFHPQQHAYRVGELIVDYAPLRRLSAFRAFETDLERALARAP